VDNIQEGVRGRKKGWNDDIERMRNNRVVKIARDEEEDQQEDLEGGCGRHLNKRQRIEERRGNLSTNKEEEKHCLNCTPAAHPRKLRATWCDENHLWSRS
jgi:hypothetical protein